MALPNYSALMPNEKKMLIKESYISTESKGSNAVFKKYLMP